MTESEREEVVELLRLAFIAMNEPELASLADHAIDTGETWIKVDAKKRLFKMLTAFDTVVALEDRQTFDSAMDSIAQTCGGEAPPVQIATIPNPHFDTATTLSFALHDQSGVRAQIATLREAIMTDDDESRDA